MCIVFEGVHCQWCGPWLHDTFNNTAIGCMMLPMAGGGCYRLLAAADGCGLSPWVSAGREVWRVGMAVTGLPSGWEVCRVSIVGIGVGLGVSRHTRVRVILHPSMTK